MIFLVVYDTTKARLVSIDEYDENSRSKATAEFRAKQASLLDELDHIEVGLFESASRSTFEQTHSRYFESVEKLRASLEELGTDLRNTATKAS
ncbi:MAG TPA: hypothetical protein VGX91_04635 [Candidatus Cybelea sp.]|jgi:hypothetical protein|nr:hypothetical protein [Candidatus Cybelea sp.]